MKMAERHARKYGFEKPPREFTRKERELLQADPAFAQWLDQLNALNELKQEPEHVQP